MEDYYKILGVSETATQDEIKKAYRTLAKEHHPDAGGDDDKFKKINEANSVLSDEKLRKDYDFKRKHPNMGNMGGFGFDPHFNDIVNEYIFRNQKMSEESKVFIPLSLLEVLNGGQKKIVFDRKDLCKTCRGSGKEKTETCPGCGGSGMQSHRIQRGNMIMETMTTCQNCGGLGNISSGPDCKDCNGQGYNTDHQEFNIEVPVGIPYGVPLRLDGRGHNGKVLNVIFTPDDNDVFERMGDDLIGELVLTYPELVLGSEKTVPTVNSSIVFKTNPYSKPDDKIKLKGQGLPNYHHLERGDLYFVIRMKEITSITPEEENLLKELTKQQNFKTNE
jgi:molecular chaperone DnaJ